MQATKDIRAYPHPNNSKLKFWELPRVGTDLYPRTTYLSNIEVDRYDFFLLMTADRFTENDTWLGNELRRRNKNYFFLRTKIAVDISHNKEVHSETHSEEALQIEKIRQDVADNLREQGCKDVPLFLVDNYEPNKFEFEQLQQQIIKEFPEQKRSSLILSLQATSEEMIRLKVTELRSRVWKSATLSAGGAAVPIPGVSVAVDLGIVTREALSYFRQLGLDIESQRRYAKLRSADAHKTQSIISNALGIKLDGPVTVEQMTSIVKMIVTKSPTLLAATAVEEGVKVLPVIGSLVAPPLSFAGTKSALNLVLDKFEETALKVMRFVADGGARADTTEMATGPEDAEIADEVAVPPEKDTEAIDPR